MTEKKLVDPAKVAKELLDREEKGFTGDFVIRYDKGVIVGLRERFHHNKGHTMDVDNFSHTSLELLKHNFYGRGEISMAEGKITKIILDHSLDIRKFI